MSKQFVIVNFKSLKKIQNLNFRLILRWLLYNLYETKSFDSATV